MKKLLLACLLITLSIASFSQYGDTSSTRQATDYLRKSNKQKSVGWILLGGGAGLTLLGVAVGSATLWEAIVDGDSDGANTAGIIALTGVASMVGSIPLFIAAGKNRRKAAAAISFKTESATIINSWAVGSIRRYPVVAIRIPL